MLIVAEQYGPVLEQRAPASQLGTADHFPAIHQHLAAGRLGKTGPRVQCRCADPGSQDGLDPDPPQRLRQESVNLQICVPQGKEAGARARDRIGQLGFVPHGTSTGRDVYGIQP